DGAPAVEQPRDGVCEKRPAGYGSGDYLGRLDDRRRQHVEQILSEPPDGRGVAEQLVRIQVQRAVEAVAEVEVPVQHQDFVLLEIPDRLFADFVLPCHRARCASGLTNTGRPPTSVAATPPRRSHPSNGVFFDRERSRDASMRTRRSGAMIVTSAGAPMESEPPAMPRIRDGFTENSSTSRGSRIKPEWTRRSSDNGIAVSSPMMPNGARSNSTFFSS